MGGLPVTLTATYHHVADGNGATKLPSTTAHVTTRPACTHTGSMHSFSNCFLFWFDEYAVSTQVLYVIAV